MRCCDCEFRNKCDDIQKVLTAFVKCYRREEFMKNQNNVEKSTNKIDMEKLCGEWEGEADGYYDGELVYDVWRCPDCGHVEETDDTDFLPNFCPCCGLAMTEKGKEILRKRLEGME